MAIPILEGVRTATMSGKKLGNNLRGEDYEYSYLHKFLGLGSGVAVSLEQASLLDLEFSSGPAFSPIHLHLLHNLQIIG